MLITSSSITGTQEDSLELTDQENKVGIQGGKGKTKVRGLNSFHWGKQRDEDSKLKIT